MPEVRQTMSDKKRKRGRPRVAPVLSYGSELKMRNNIARNIKKPRYLCEQDEEDSISRGSTPARSIDNVSVHSKGSLNGRSKNGRGYNPEIDDKDSEYHYGSDFDDESDVEKVNPGPDSRSISEATSDLEESDVGDLNIDDGETLGVNTEAPPSFVPFWKLGPAGNLGYRPQTPIPVWLQERSYPVLDLPQSSDDLLMPRPFVLQAIGIYEVLRHFRNIVKLSPFHFEDFCACLLADEQSILLSEIHIALTKALIREEDAQQTHFGQLDQKDSINIALYFVDSVTWPETLRVYLQSDPKEFKEFVDILNSCNYPHTSLINRLKVLQFLCDQFLQTSVVREDLLSEGKIRYDDHCRACHKTGDLLCCDSCSAVYHLDCADPPLSNVPLEIEDWTCTVCNKHKIEGVTDCSSLMENSGLMCRQEPLGFDRHGRKYWFLVRRIVVESEEGTVWYYSTLEQLDLILLLMDNVDLEEALYVALKEFGDDIRKQMEITEKITEKARGTKKVAITVEMEDTRREIEKIQEEKEKTKKKEESEKLSKIIEEVKEESNENIPDKTEKPELKLDVKEEASIKEEAIDFEEKAIDIKEEAADTKEAIDIKEEAIEMKEEVPEDAEHASKLSKCSEEPIVKKEKICTDEEIELMIDTKKEQLKLAKGHLYRLGCDHTFRSYVNHFVNNSLALNKLQHNEERDKKRHLSHKFSLTNNSEFKWQAQSFGTSDNQMTNVRQTLLSLEQNISVHFFHPNWQYVRKAWSQFVGCSSTVQDFGKALLWLVACIKPVIFTNAWHESLGHIRLKRITALDREERKKQEKRERREADDESKLFPLVKFTKGVKHQLWKVKGEEYRIHGLWGWQWISCNRKVTHVPMSTVGLRAGPEKITIPIKSNGESGGVIRGLPISAASYYQLAAKTPSLQFSLLSPKLRKERDPPESQNEKKKKEIMLANAGQFEVSPIDLENYFEDGVINVSNELSTRLRLVYPKITKGSTFLDSLLTRRLALKIQEERDRARNKKVVKESKRDDADSRIDVENDSDSTLSDDNNNSNVDGGDDDEVESANIEEIPDSQRKITIDKRRPAGHLLKEMRTHKFKYEALDKLDEALPCYSPSCRKGGRGSCYSPSCIIKMKTKQKLVNSVSNYKIITCKPAPFDNVGSCSPVRLSDPETSSTSKSELMADVSIPGKTFSPNGQLTSFSSEDGSARVKEKSFLKLSMDEDSSHSQCSLTTDSKNKEGRIFSTENTSGKIYLKKSMEVKKPKKHKIPPINYFRVFKKVKKWDKEETVTIQKIFSLFDLPAWELRILARKGGRYSPNGFGQVSKINQYFWPYPCPRPVFKITWLYRTTLVSNINAVAYQLRILWACLKWDEMHEKGVADGRKQITTDIEIVQTEILKRKISGRFHERTDYLRRKVTIPLDVPKPIREFTPSQRSGLRKRRRAQSPVNKQPQSFEEWVEEDKLDLWEIRYFGERLEKAALLSKKSEKIEVSNFSSLSRSTSPAEFKAKMEEQLKIQRANFNQKRSIEKQDNLNSNKGIVKVAIGSVIPGSGNPAAKMTFSNAGKLVQGGSTGGPSIVTVGTKLPSVLAGKKIVTTKGGKIITVQTSGSGLTLNNQLNDNPTKISLGKSSVFPVSSLPKVQVTPQGNKVIKLQNITTGGQRAILPRVATAQSIVPPTLIRPLTTCTNSSATSILQSTSSPVSTIRPVISSQQIQILRLPDGQFQVKGLQEGQQLLQRGDGKLQVVSTKIGSSTIATSAISPTTTQIKQPLPATALKDIQMRGITPLSGNQILRINGQQVILRTSGTAPNGKQIMSVSAKDTALATSAAASAINISVPKFKTPDDLGQKFSSPTPDTVTSPSLLKERQISSEERQKIPLLSSTPPSSPTKGGVPTTGVSTTMTLRVQVRMTEQGPKTIIQGLQPGVGLTKDHIMAIQQQVRSMLSQYNLQVNQLSPLMTLTLHATNKGQQNTNRSVNAPSSPVVTSNQTVPQKPILSSKCEQSDMNEVNSQSENLDPMGLKELPSDSKENSKENAQNVETIMPKNDIAPENEKLQIQKLGKSKKATHDTPYFGKGTKRSRDQDERDWVSSAGPPVKPKVSKRARSEKVKLKRDTSVCTSSITSVSSVPSAVTSSFVNSKLVIQDAKKKLARQQKLEGILSKHKDLLKKDILKKRALLEKELQLQIHRDLSAARQQMQTLEKIKAGENLVAPQPKKVKPDTRSLSPIPPPPTTPRESSKTKKNDSPSAVATYGGSTGGVKTNPKIALKNNKKSGKSKSKKVVCICRTFFDDTKFYVGCDLCGNWFHGDCVGITEALSRSMTEYVCDDCANAKLNKDLFCFCRQPYDETQFYICCEKCEDWYHGKCIGIMQAEADDIDDYICPKCDSDNRWNRPCQKILTDKDQAELKKVAKMLITHKNAWPFLEPVDQSEVPDYYKVVKQPMDLKAVERKVSQRKYKALYEFVGDVMLVFDNCRAYNPPNSSFCSCANNLEVFFCVKLKQLKIKISPKA